ncbi:conserved hypothetical protein, partial [Ricinus communis]
MQQREQPRRQVEPGLAQQPGAQLRRHHQFRYHRRIWPGHGGAAQRFVGRQRQRHPQVGGGDAQCRHARLERRARARAGLAHYPAGRAQRVRIQRVAVGPRMIGRHHRHHAVLGDRDGHQLRRV